MYHLKTAIIKASGGTVNGFYFDMMEMEAWKLIELIEIVEEVNSEAKGEYSQDQLGTWLGARAK